MSTLLPSLIINPGDPLFIGATAGFLLAMPVALLLAYWICDVKNKIAVLVGAFMGSLLGFIGVLGLVNTLIFSTSLPDTNGAATFFGTLFLCSILGLIGAILTDLAVAHSTAKGRQKVHLKR